MYFNRSYDGGTFEEMTPLQIFTKLIELREQALWMAEQYHYLGLNGLAIRYAKLMNYIEDRMRRVEV